MPQPTVRADQCKGRWIWVEIEGEQRARVRISTVNANGRTVEVGITKHPTCGNFKRSWPRDHEFELAP